MGTLEQTRDTRRLRWPLSLTRAPQKNFLEATDYQPFLDDLSKSSNPHWGKEKQQFVRKNGESESQGCLSTTSRSRTPAATLSSLSRCLFQIYGFTDFTKSRRLTLNVSQVLEPSKGGGQQMALSPAITRRDDYRLGPTSSWGETSRHQSSERWRKAAKN